MRKPDAAPAHRFPLHLAGALVVAGCGLLLACGDHELASHWRDRPLVIDGQLEDWAGLQTSLPRADARIAVANDADALYLSLETSDPNLARLIAHRGLTLWFDPTGGEKQTLGVRFPLPADAPPSRWGEIGGSRPGGAQLDSLELLGPQPYTRRQLTPPGADGVEVAVGGGPGVITYELRVPLAAAAAWGLGVAPGARLGVGVEAKGVRAGGPRGRDGEGGRDGGRRRPRDGDGDSDGSSPPDAGRGGYGRGARPGVVHDFDAWSVVRLAVAPG